jgi:hypothetical protein
LPVTIYRCVRSDGIAFPGILRLKPGISYFNRF